MKSADRDPTGKLQPDAGKHEADDLELESTSSQTMRGIRLSRQFGSGGYNPYDTIPNASSSTGVHRMQDMRRLSEWIRLKREMARKDKG